MQDLWEHLVLVLQATDRPKVRLPHSRRSATQKLEGADQSAAAAAALTVASLRALHQASSHVTNECWLVATRSWYGTGW